MPTGTANDTPRQASAAPQPATPTPPPYTPPEDPEKLLRLTPEMEAFFRSRMRSRPGSEARLQQMLEAIIEAKGLALSYDGEATLDPATTFQLHRANCVGFSLLVVAVARAFGYEARFQNVRDATRWDRFGRIVASVQHVNVRVETDEGSYVVDLRPDLVPHPDSADIELVDDRRVFADFYSDIGFFRLVHGDSTAALHYMTLATAVDSRSASAWANRAMICVRLGDDGQARSCFERSLALNRNGTTALVGLVDLLQRSGTPEDLRRAQQYQRRAQHIREQNPYYHEHLARLAADAGDWNTAEKELRRAIRLKDTEHDFHAELASVLERLDRTAQARREAAEAARLQKR